MAIPPCLTIELEGTITPLVVVLDRAIAPVTIARVVELFNAGYYHRTTWHRVLDTVVIGGNPAGHDEGGVPRFIRDEVGDRVAGPQLVLPAHDRDTADGRLAIRVRGNATRYRRDTVLGSIIGFNGVVEHSAMIRVWVGAPREWEEPRKPCHPSKYGIPLLAR
jgi:cyclophilin family peptidyl-prolyl cis-trans isomerase